VQLIVTFSGWHWEMGHRAHQHPLFVFLNGIDPIPSHISATATVTVPVSAATTT
jgi:hypothetical protein